MYWDGTIQECSDFSWTSQHLRDGYGDFDVWHHLYLASARRYYLKIQCFVCLGDCLPWPELLAEEVITAAKPARLGSVLVFGWRFAGLIGLLRWIVRVDRFVWLRWRWLRLLWVPPFSYFACLICGYLARVVEGLTRYLNVCLNAQSAKIETYQCLFQAWLLSIPNLLPRSQGWLTRREHGVFNNLIVCASLKDSHLAKSHMRSQELYHAKIHSLPLHKQGQKTVFLLNWQEIWAL